MIAGSRAAFVNPSLDGAVAKEHSDCRGRVSRGVGR